MNASILQDAHISFGRQEKACPAIIQIDGMQWQSVTTENAGEAALFNSDAREIAERLNRK